MRRCIAALLIAGTGACASAPRATAPTLAYAMPPVNPALYELTDTTRVRVEADRGRNLDTTIGLTARAHVGTHVDSAGLLASVRLATVRGTIAVGDQVTLQADSASLPTGAALLRLGGRGIDSTMHVPGMPRSLARIIGGESFFHHFFVRLPGGPTVPGTEWTDTVSLTDEGAGVTSRTRTVVVSTLRGDTTIDARVLRVIDSRITTTIEVDGIVDGMQVSQRLIGAGTAVSLWDEPASMLVAREETLTANGTMDLPVAGLRGAPVASTTRRVLRLVP